MDVAKMCSQCSNICAGRSEKSHNVCLLYIQIARIKGHIRNKYIRNKNAAPCT